MITASELEALAEVHQERAAKLRALIAPAREQEAGLRDRERAAYIFGREKSFAQGNQGLFHEYMAGVIVEAEELYPEAARPGRKGE